MASPDETLLPHSSSSTFHSEERNNQPEAVGSGSGSGSPTCSFLFNGCKVVTRPNASNGLSTQPERVGAFVGTAVAADGWELGNGLGKNEGGSLFCNDGPTEGSKLGFADGLGVGEDVGEALSCTVGPNEGSKLKTTDGLGVGTSVGATDGLDVGLVVEDSVGPEEGLMDVGIVAATDGIELGSGGAAVGLTDENRVLVPEDDDL
jgi:hypothetical protein